MDSHMVTIPHREEKWEILSSRRNGPIAHWSHDCGPRVPAHHCAIAYQRGKEIGVSMELHHRFHDTANHRARCPHLIHSMLNLMPVNHGWHMNNPSAFKIGDYEAARLERWLERHPVFCAYVNDPSKSLSEHFRKHHEKRNRDKTFVTLSLERAVNWN